LIVVRLSDNGCLDLVRPLSAAHEYESQSGRATTIEPGVGAKMVTPVNQRSGLVGEAANVLLEHGSHGGQLSLDVIGSEDWIH